MATGAYPKIKILIQLLKIKQLLSALEAMTSKIHTTHIELPEFTEDVNTIIQYAEKWTGDLDERSRQKIIRLFKNANVNRRYSIMSVDEVFTPRSFEERNNIYIERVTDLCEKALRNALAKANVKHEELDMIISTSCTGIMIPSVDAFLVNRLKLRQDIIRLPVTEMGCAGGTSALIYANEFAKANPKKVIAVLAVESATSTFLMEDKSLTNAVSAAIFGDGCAVAIIKPSEDIRPAIIDTQMYHFFDQPRLMGFDLKNAGLQIVLDPEVPVHIEKEFSNIIFPFLEKNKLKIEDVNNFIFHPGGKKIVQVVDDLFGQYGKNIDATKEVLFDYGNMSSATVLYVLNKYMDRNIAKGEYGLMLSFGPGFTAQTLLLQWQ
jgi:alkylresorcinol/alkylpyrone synthase